MPSASRSHEPRGSASGGRGSELRSPAGRPFRHAGRASETRIRHPPEKDEVGCFCISASKPRPKRIAPARAGADLQGGARGCEAVQAGGKGVGGGASARAVMGADLASISSSRSAISSNLVCRSCSSSMSSASLPPPLAVTSASSSSCSRSSSASSASSALRSTSVASTISSTLAAPPATSCSMCRICRLGGTPSKRAAARNLRKVVLPMPLRPTWLR